MWKEDDEAAVIGKILATKFSDLFSDLSRICSNAGGRLYLMCQSFGHHILNSFMEHSYDYQILFDKIFLMFLY